MSETITVLQWRAGQSSGQTEFSALDGLCCDTPSMEGRTIVRPDPTRPSTPCSRLWSLQWRAGQSSGQTTTKWRLGKADGILQWRAGQSSGQTTIPNGCSQQFAITFNGGPDNRPARPGRSTGACNLGDAFNGGPDNRPARQGTADQDRLRSPPSMEGRTIVRPARLTSQPSMEGRQSSGQWPTSGGKPSMEGRTIVRPDPKVPPSMEGRTIVRPDTHCSTRVTIIPSMEGRTIVRPDCALILIAHPTRSFNGGPDNRPARLQRPRRGSWTPSGLQWRAGQSSGQTEPPGMDKHTIKRVPSMEGRTIVRPDAR